jgi:FtsP/CotA-like multicopper oxidase with cupredoxin domain
MIEATESLARVARRRFSRRTLVVTAGIVFSVLLASKAAPQAAPVCPSAGPAFVPVGEIKSQGGKLQAVMKVVSGKRNVPNKTGPPTESMLRYFDGYNPADPSQKWPVTPSAAGPGPTLRAEIGDVVNITLLNQVKVQDFGGSLDSGEEGRNNGCDQVTKVNPDGTTDKNWYPADDKYPNCFHGSSSANIHFHGTHVTPSTTGDNVLVNVRPNEKVTERDVREPFQQIFQHCAVGEQPAKWGDLPQSWRDFQETLLREYDTTAPYVGPGRTPSGHGLPRDLQLWPQDQQAVANGLWPQWYSGSYPYCFQIPKYTEDKDGNSNLRMGQAPGTHWYHSHKHGSTSINLFNGLAGAFIITDNSPTGYDGKLKAFYNDKLEEKVLVIQQITSLVNMLSAKHPPQPPPLVNGELTPTITMQPGQVQLWRIINATVQAFVNANFSPAATAGTGIHFRQTAQDGVQLAWKNYSNSENGTNPINMAPANRVDLLVQAPTTPGCYVLQDTKLGPLLYVTVTGDEVSPAMGFPTAEGDYPTLPPFLEKIDPATIHLRRDITFASKKSTTAPTDRRRIQFTIDGKQFEDQTINQVMLLDSAEEWTIYNTDTGTGIAHPFHIHVNPFQVLEIYDPNKTPPLQELSPPYVWWDTFAIPPPSKNPDGTLKEAGYFKMRTRFVDFTGQYVQHCHILAHEDRGMMQLLEVVSNKTILKHH